jgi:hypothetical protein
VRADSADGVLSIDVSVKPDGALVDDAGRTVTLPGFTSPWLERR